MSDIQRIPFATEQVTIPQTNITKAPIPERSPIAEAVGQAASIAGNVAEVYQKAQFAFDATEANLEITKRVNAYQENLRNNPILPVIGENIVETKQKDWQEFSNKLQKDFISGIDNTQLRSALTDDWNLKSERFRGEVVNNAIDENIAFMSNRLSDDINELVLAGDFDGAERAIALGEQSALLDREQAVDFNDFVDRSELMDGLEANNTPFSEGKNIINSSELTVAEKGKAQSIWQDREDERIRVEKEQLKASQEFNMEEAFLAISRGELTQSNVLDDMLSPEGRYGDNTSSQGEQMRAALRRNQADRDKGTAKDDSRALNYIDGILMKPESLRGDVLGAMYDMTERGWLSSGTFISYYNKLDTDAFRNKNQVAYGLLEQGIKEMEKEGLLGTTSQQIENTKRGILETARNLHFGEHLTAREIATEAGFGEEQAVKLLNNLRDTSIVNALQQGSLGETNGQSKWTNAEEFVSLGAQGRLFGKVFTDQLGGFLSDPTMSPQELKESLSQSYGGTFASLSPINKSRVQTTMVAGDLIRKTEQLFVQEYSKDGIAGIEPETNLPTMTVDPDPAVSGDETFYRLNIDVNKKEEVWEIFDDIDGWIRDETRVVRDLKSRGEVQVQFENLLSLPGRFNDFLKTTEIRPLDEFHLEERIQLFNSLNPAEQEEFLRDATPQEKAKFRKAAEVGEGRNMFDNQKNNSTSTTTNPSTIPAPISREEARRQRQIRSLLNE